MDIHEEILKEKENIRYPRHESDRVDELIEELDPEQVKELYSKLKKIDYFDWLNWLENERKDISKYDNLNTNERKKKLQKSTDANNLLLHHACMFIELWRTRLRKQYLPLPPNGISLETPEIQREMMLASVASFNNYDMRDFWPFEHEDIDINEDFPFKDADEHHDGKP